MVFWVFAALAALILGALFAPLSIDVWGRLSLSEQGFTVRVKPPLFPFYIGIPSLKARKTQSVPDASATGPPDYSGILTTINRLGEYRRSLARMARRAGRAFAVERLSLRLALGTGDAASTALSCGFASAALSCGVSVAGRYTRFRKPPSIRVQPVYASIAADFSIHLSVKTSLARLVSLSSFLYGMYLSEFRWRGAFSGKSRGILPQRAKTIRGSS